MILIKKAHVTQNLHRNISKSRDCPSPTFCCGSAHIGFSFGLYKDGDNKLEIKIKISWKCSKNCVIFIYFKIFINQQF